MHIPLSVVVDLLPHRSTVAVAIAAGRYSSKGLCTPAFGMDWFPGLAESLQLIKHHVGSALLYQAGCRRFDVRACKKAPKSFLGTLPDMTVWSQQRAAS